MSSKYIYAGWKETHLEYASPPAPDELVRRHWKPGVSLLAVLHAIQDEAGFIPPEVVTPLARAMNLSRAEVHGVLTYYHHFRTSAPPRVGVALCRAESCRSMGTEALAAHIEARTGCRFDAKHAGGTHHGHATEGEAVELESVYCLGQCALSPAMTINGTLHAKVTPAKFDALFEAACTQAGIDPAHKESV